MSFAKLKADREQLRQRAIKDREAQLAILDLHASPPGTIAKAVEHYLSGDVSHPNILRWLCSHGKTKEEAQQILNEAIERVP